MNKKKFPEGFFTKDRPIAKPRYIDADGLREYWLTNGKNERVYNTNDFLDSIDYQPTADVQQVDKVLNVINGMITTEHSERNCVIEEVYQKVAELKGYGDEHE